MPGALFCGDIHVGVGVAARLGTRRPASARHPVGGPFVYQLDDRPAVSIYEDFLGLKREELMQEPLANVTLTYPLGTEIKGQAEYLSARRDPCRAAGSLICTGNVAEGSEVRLMIGGYESALEAAQQAACDAVDRLGDGHVKGALVSSAAWRARKCSGANFRERSTLFADALGGSGDSSRRLLFVRGTGIDALRRGRALKSAPYSQMIRRGGGPWIIHGHMGRRGRYQHAAHCGRALEDPWVSPVLLDTAEKAYAARLLARQREPPALIILDMLLPGMSGVDLIRLIKQNMVWEKSPWWS